MKKNAGESTPDSAPKADQKTLRAFQLPASTVSTLLTPLVDEDPDKPRNQHPPALTRRKKAQFLKLLAMSGQHCKSCKLAGIDFSTPHQWAIKDEQFSKRWTEAKQAGEKVLIAAYEQDLDDIVSEPLFLQHTSNLRMFRMKKLDPSYRDNPNVNVAISGPAQINLGVDGAE